MGVSPLASRTAGDRACRSLAPYTNSFIDSDRRNVLSSPQYRHLLQSRPFIIEIVCTARCICCGAAIYTPRCAVKNMISL